MDRGDFFELAVALGLVQAKLGAPSKRDLARIAGCSPTTIDTWLFKRGFPQDVGQILKVVEAIRKVAARQGRVDIPGPEVWRAAHAAERKRRSDQGSKVMQSVAAREARPGTPVHRCDPVLLGVRRGIVHDTPGLPSLTQFVPRTHDDGLTDRIARGGVVALVGTSSTGKSRSAWEAVRELGREWRLWRPGKWAELDDLGSHTVIWLGDLRQLSEDQAEQLVAAVSDYSRAPVTVVATLWPEDLSHLTADAAPGTVDSLYWRRTLLTGHEIRVPDTFTPLDRADLATAVQVDRRWDRATREAGKKVIQYFAGVPRLIELYQFGPVMVRALIEAAMDAHRLGVAELMPRDFLIEAAPGYPSDTDWLAVRGTPWPEEALGVAATSVRGLPGPLHPHVPRTLDTSEPVGYTLAPYLAQLGRADREAELPPATFWQAIRRYLPPTAWAKAARHADRYGLRRVGKQLREAAPTDRMGLTSECGTSRAISPAQGNSLSLEANESWAGTGEEDPRAQFVDELRRLRMQAGGPTQAALQRQDPHWLNRATLSALLSGEFLRVPPWERIAAFVTACVQIGNDNQITMPPVDVLLTEWRHRHEVLNVALEGPALADRATSGSHTGVRDVIARRAQGQRARFVEELRRLRMQAGEPKLHVLQSQDPEWLSQAAVSRLLSGNFDRAPSWERIAAFVTACVQIGNDKQQTMPPVDVLLTEWRHRQAALYDALE